MYFIQVVTVSKILNRLLQYNPTHNAVNHSFLNMLRTSSSYVRLKMLNEFHCLWISRSYLPQLSSYLSFKKLPLICLGWWTNNLNKLNNDVCICILRRFHRNMSIALIVSYTYLRRSCRSWLNLSNFVSLSSNWMHSMTRMIVREFCLDLTNCYLL